MRTTPSCRICPACDERDALRPFLPTSYSTASPVGLCAVYDIMRESEPSSEAGRLLAAEALGILPAHRYPLPAEGSLRSLSPYSRGCDAPTGRPVFFFARWRIVSSFFGRNEGRSVIADDIGAGRGNLADPSDFSSLLHSAARSSQTRSSALHIVFIPPNNQRRQPQRRRRADRKTTGPP